MSKRDRLIDAPERRGRSFDDFEIRADGDTLEFRGYASVFEAPYDVLGGPAAGGWTEVVDRRAFDVTLDANPDVMFLVNHEGMPLARTKSKTLRLSADRTGLLTAADLDLRDSDVQRLKVKMDRGDMDEMSFAFRTKQHQWDDDETERRLLEVSIHKGDVSVVNHGANPATAGASLRSTLAVLRELGAGDMLAEVRSLHDPVAELRAARNMLDRLIGEYTQRKTLSLGEVEALLEADAA